MEVILQALSSCEEERVCKTRLALLALCQAGTASLAAQRAEEEARAARIDAIDVGRDLQAFVAATLSFSSSSSSVSSPKGVGEDSGSPSVVLEDMGQTQHGAALADKLGLLAKGGPQAIIEASQSKPLPREEEEEDGKELLVESVVSVSAESDSFPPPPLSPPALLSPPLLPSIVAAVPSDTRSSPAVSTVSLDASLVLVQSSSNGPKHHHRAMNSSVGSIDLTFVSDAEEEKEGEEEEDVGGDEEGEGEEEGSVVEEEGEGQTGGVAPATTMSLDLMGKSDRLRSGGASGGPQEGTKGHGGSKGKDTEKKKRLARFFVPSISRELSVSVSSWCVRVGVIGWLVGGGYEALVWSLCVNKRVVVVPD